MLQKTRILILSICLPLTVFSQRQQILTPNPSQLTSPSDNQVSITVNYSTSNPENEPTNGLGLQMHFDSTKLHFIDLSNVSANDLVQLDVPQTDTDNDDGDADTDKYVLIAWVNDDNNWSGASELFTAEFQTLFGSEDSTKINFTTASSAVVWDPTTQTGSRYGFSAQSVRIAEGNLQQTIHLIKGWNHISFNIRPDNVTVNSVFSNGVGYS